MKAMKFCLLAVAVMVIASGCLTSPNAFYTDGDVFQDDRILGDYTEEKAEEGSIVRRDLGHPGRYLFHCFNKRNPQKWMDLTATLLAGTNSYVDLLPYDDSCIDRVAGAPPAGMDIIRSVTHQPLHVVAQITITDDGIAVSLPQKRTMWEMVQRHPAFTNYVRDESVLVFPQSSKELRALLEKEGGTLFPKPIDFKKPRPLPK